MKKLFYLFGIIIIFSACKFEDKGYSFLREYDDGTYLTSRGVAKYISGSPDSVIEIGDVYAIAKAEIRYTDNKKDSILIYGHCWSVTESQSVTDENSTKFMVDANEDKLPDDFVVTLDNYESVISNLLPETPYYLRSYVITGLIEDGIATYLDTAYNPVSVIFETNAPTNEWKEQEPFPSNQWRGAISFVYKNEIYVGLGKSEFGHNNDIYKFDPKNNTWEHFAVYPGAGNNNKGVTNAVAFVIEDVYNPSNHNYYDYVYIGLGKTIDGNCVTDFWRWDFKNANWVRLSDLSGYPGAGVENAVGFSLDGFGYVGLGTGTSGSAFNTFYKFNPIGTNNLVGNWTQMPVFVAGARSKAVSFVIESDGYESSAFVCGGVTNSGSIKNDLYMFRQNDIHGNGSWAPKEDFPGTPRYDAVGFTIGSMGYVGTGKTEADTLCKDFWRYNPFTNKWDERVPFYGTPRHRAVGAGLIYGDGDYRGYIGLGTDTIDNNTNYVNDFWEYRP